MRIAQDKQPADQNEGKTRRTRSRAASPGQWPLGPIVVTTTDRSGSHSLAVVAATAVVLLPLPGCVGFYATLRIPTRLLLGCCLFLPLKGE